jgi:hypothetical protein
MISSTWEVNPLERLREILVRAGVRPVPAFLSLRAAEIPAARLRRMQSSIPGKHGLLVHSAAPLNAEPPAGRGWQHVS